MVAKRCAVGALIFLTVIAGLAVAAWCIFMIFDNRENLGFNFVGDQSGVDAVVPDDPDNSPYAGRWFLDVNYFSNANNNGMVLQEMRMNYFVSHDLTVASYNSTGMQHIGRFQHDRAPYQVHRAEAWTIFGWQGANVIGQRDVVNRRVNPRFHYYETVANADGTNPVSWAHQAGGVGTELNRNTQLIIRMGDEPFMLQLNQYRRTQNTMIMYRHIDYYHMSWSRLFEQVMLAVRSSTATIGRSYLTRFNLSNYFTIHPIINGDVHRDRHVDHVFSYFVVRVNYNPNGARHSGQSMFGIIANDPNFDLTDNTYNTEFWQERVEIVIGAAHMNRRYSALHGGYLLTPSPRVLEQLSNMRRIYLVIDVTAGDGVVGFDFAAFMGIELHTVRIRGSGDFHLLTNSLRDTQLRHLDVAPMVNIVNHGEVAT